MTQTRIKPTAPVNERFIKPEAAMAELCYTDKSAFWTFVHASGVPHVRLNARRILFERASLNAWLDRRTVGKGFAQ